MSDRLMLAQENLGLPCKNFETTNYGSTMVKHSSQFRVSDDTTDYPKNNLMWLIFYVENLTKLETSMISTMDVIR